MIFAAATTVFGNPALSADRSGEWQQFVPLPDYPFTQATLLM
ncbi:hypothetical protein [Phocaeicola sp.]|nr:hypothetical protein [Phocaeicola sp.]